jgi:pSer/pThr/pTyr-binding forkhead associated (FHA) protein
MAGEFLRVLRGPRAGAEVRVTDAEVVLGREAEGPGYLGEDPRLSRRHARLLRAADGGLLVEDLGSLNGTLVNDRPADGAQRLAPGDVVAVGGAALVVLDADGRGGQAKRLGAQVAPAPAAAARRAPVIDARVIALTALFLVAAIVVVLLVT